MRRGIVLGLLLAVGTLTAVVEVDTLKDNLYRLRGGGGGNTGQAPTPAVGVRETQSQDPFNTTQLLNNERVTVSRLTFKPSQRSDPVGKPHSDSLDAVAIMLTPGDVEINIGEKSETGHQSVGKVWWLPRSPLQHSLANVGKEPWDVIVVALKPSRSVPLAPVPTGFFRQRPGPPNAFNNIDLLRNDRVRVYRMTFQVGQRTDWVGVTHPAPQDAIVVMMTPGVMEMNTGEVVEIGPQKPGKVWWVPKPPALHSLAHAGYVGGEKAEPFNIIVVMLESAEPVATH